MNSNSFHLPVKSLGTLFLFIMLFIPNFSHAQLSCPDYPRRYDEVFVCLEDNKLIFKQNVSIHNPVRFKFIAPPAGCYYNVYFNNGGGYTDIHVGDPTTYEISYPAEGQYSIYWNVFLENSCCDPYGNPIYTDTLLGQGIQLFQIAANPQINFDDYKPDSTWTDITGNTFTPPINNGYSPFSQWDDPQTAGGIVNILYANADHKFRKPFILVDGFDPVLKDPDEFKVINPNGTIQGYGSIRWDVLMTGREEVFDVDTSEAGIPHGPRWGLFPSLVQGLRARGFDIVLVDLADGGNYIQANGEFLIKVIEQINNRKIGTFPNTLIGASMGGFVGRYALSKMESEGKNHCTGLFGTFDTPNNGANIPLAIQGFAWFAHAAGLTNDAWKAMNTPAARQMLITHIGSEIQAGRVRFENLSCGVVANLDFSELETIPYGVLRTQLQNELDGFGWPKRPRKIALLNGRKNGTQNDGQGFGPGDRFYDARGYAENYDFGTVANVAMRATNGGKETYRINGTTFCSNKWSADCSTGEHALFSAAIPDLLLDCGIKEIPFNYHNVALNDESGGSLPHLDNAPGSYLMTIRQIDEELKKKISGVVTYTSHRLPKQTFVPTWSGLAMATPLNNNSLFVDLSTSEFAEENLPNAKVPNYDNFYAPAANLRHVELDGGMLTFIFQELDRLIAAPQEGDLTTEYNYGKLYKDIPNTIIKSTGRLNVNNTGATGYVNSNPLPPATKPTFTTYLRDCGQLIEVESGGQFNIGSLDKGQHGITEVWAGCTVHVKAGGVLHITSENSKLFIKHGAELILEQGAIVYLESPGSKILLEGNLVLRGDIIFKGLGYFDFSVGNKMVFEKGYNTFKLNGVDKINRFVRISAPTNLDNGHRLYWTNGLIEFGSTMYLSSDAGLDFYDVTLHGDGAATALDFNNGGSISINNSKVEYLDNAIIGVGPNGCTINTCVFDHYNNTQVFWSDGLSVIVINSIFDGNGAYNALWFQDVTTPRIQGCDFQGHFEELGPITELSLYTAQAAAVKLFNVTTCLVDGSHFRSNTIGIKAGDEAQPSNVYVYHGSSFTDHDAAIYVNGDGGAATGTVLVDCSMFTDNRNGIRGRDINLIIDSWGTANWTWDTDSPNRFARSSASDIYVQVCFDQKPVPASVLMRNNFWVIGTAPDPNPAGGISLLHNDCEEKALGPSLFPLGARRPECWNFPLRGERAETDFLESDCTEKIGDSGNSIQEQVFKGLSLLRENNFEPAMESFRPVAALWQNDLSAYGEHCRQGILLAKSMVDSYNAQPLAEQKQLQNSAETSGGLKIVPNPANAFVTLYLDKGNCRVKVMDVQGRVKVQGYATEKMELNTQDWDTGVYLVETVNDSGITQTGKLMIQR